MSGRICEFLLGGIPKLCSFWESQEELKNTPQEVVDELVTLSRDQLFEQKQNEAVTTCLRGCAYHPNFLLAYRLLEDLDWDHSTITYPANLWREGESLVGEKLLVALQGGSDLLFLYAKLIPILLEKGAQKVFFLIEEELHLLIPSMPGVELITNVDEGNGVTKCLPLHLLPSACEIDVVNFPKTSYLVADAEMKDALKSHFPEGLKIGLILPEGLSSAASRALVGSLDRFGTLLLLHGGSSSPGLDLRPEIEGWQAKAAAIDLCDVIIACDGAEAHLSAALGKPTLVPVRGDAHPLWSEGVLYENAREFRQDRLYDWTKVSSELYQYFEEHSREWSQNQ